MAAIVVRHQQGIYLPEADLWLDPAKPKAHAFVSHAHADHVAKHQNVLASALTADLLQSRFNLKIGDGLKPLPWNQPIPWREDWLIRLLPAGHIPGSAMLHLTRRSDQATLLYTGDFKRRPGLSTPACQLAPADTLIMECTFGLPQYQFPPLQEIREQALNFIHETLAQDKIPVLLGYSLGKAQEILCLLQGSKIPVMLHQSVWKMTEQLRPHLPPIPNYSPFDAAWAQGHILIFPPMRGSLKALQGLPTRSAIFTGWGLDPGARWRLGADLAIPLSDHADHPELLDTVACVKPKHILLVHGYTREFSALLRSRGHDAWSLGREDQMDLPLGNLGLEEG